MITTAALNIIANETYSTNGTRYVVVTDHTGSFDDVGVGETEENKTHNIVYAGNNYEQAVKTTNFWDERMNVHLVEVDTARMDCVNFLIDNDFEAPSTDSPLGRRFAKLSVTEKIDLYTEVALKRIL